MKHVVIIGAGYSGLMTALRLQRQNIRVTLINKSATFDKRIHLHQIAAGRKIPTFNLQDFLSNTRVQFVQAYVQNVLPDQKQIVLEDRIVDYDILVIATGSHVNRDIIPGIREHAYTLDAASVKQFREQLTPGKRILVVGGGLTGIEAAAEFAAQFRVGLVTNSQIGENLSPKAAQYIRDSLTRAGVTLYEGVTVREIHRDHVDTHTGQMPFDLCLWAGGFVANPLATQAGFSVTRAGQMRLRDTLQSIDHDHVFGVGDAGAVTMQNGAILRMSCETAMPAGVHAADNIIRLLDGKPSQPFDFGYTMQCIDLGRGAALTQFVRADGTPTSHILTGLVGKLVKTMISHYTILSLRLEKWLPGSYRYPKGIQATRYSEKLTV